jgi:hypothetical protein
MSVAPAVTLSTNGNTCVCESVVNVIDSSRQQLS